MTTISNRLEAIIMDYEIKLSCTFKPTRIFFKKIGIGHRRFYQLVRNEVSPTFQEMIHLAAYFDVSVWEFHESTMSLAE